MATSSEISWFWDYSTLVDNEIVCDICFAPYVISVDDEVKIHLHNQHKEVNVSPEDLQENKDLQFYKIQNNSIQCTLCNNEIYTSMNTDYVIIIRHLKHKHRITKNLAEEIYKLLHGYYKLKLDEADRNEKQCCNECKIMIPNKPSFLINHVNEAHRLSIHRKIRLSYIAESWVWSYFNRDENIATCTLCNTAYKDYLMKSLYSINTHLKNMHREDYDRAVSSKKSTESQKLLYYEIQNNQVKCDICKQNFKITFSVNCKLASHLTYKHKLNAKKSKTLRNWQLKYFNKVDSQTSRCMLCPKIFRGICSFNLIKHLKLHGIEILPEIISMGATSSSCSFLNSDNDKDTAISSSNQQPTSSSDQISNFDDVNDHIEVFSETRPTGLSSSSSSVSISVDCLRKYFISEEVDEKCWMCDNNYLLQKTNTSIEDHINIEDSQQNVSSDNSQVLYKLSFTIEDEQTKGYICDVQTSRCTICGIRFIKCNSFTLSQHLIEFHPLKISSEIYSMGLPSTSSNILDDEDTEGIAASNIDQQSARDEISNSGSSNLLYHAAENVLDPAYDNDFDEIFSVIDNEDSDNSNIP